MVARTTPDAPAETALTAAEIEVLDRMPAGAAPALDTSRPKRTVSHCLMAIAVLGGYLARERGPPPGNVVVWRGLSRLADILHGFELGSQLVGN